MPAWIASRLERRSSDLSIEQDGAAIGPEHAEDRERQFGATSAKQTGEAQRFTASDCQRDVLVVAGAT